MPTTFSYEFFPPKTPEADEALWPEMTELAGLDPKYMTVTYGAAGSTKDGTLTTLQRAVQDFSPTPFASHLTFLSTPKEELEIYIDALWDAGVTGIVALRGDLPKGTSFDDFQGEDYYKLTSEFVQVLKSKYPFRIIVGAYPEKHPDAKTLDDDIEALKLKCAAGADAAKTQFFFDNEVYYRFLDLCEKAGIDTPIYPGLLPIHDFPSMVRFAGKCQAGVPDWLHEQFEGLEEKPDEARKRATDLLVKQTQDLAANGVEHIHYYSLNKAAITKEACQSLKNAAQAA